MNDPTVDTVVRRVESEKQKRCWVKRSITFFRMSIAALARAALICVLITVPWEGHGFGVNVVMAQTGNLQEKGNTGIAITPSLNPQDLHLQLEQILREKTPATPFEKKSIREFAR